jgi:oligopeptide/dipeptide ABC transporter ATP-binding protein
VILDEPLSALDVSVQAQIILLLQRLQHEHGVAYLLISHDLSAVRRLSTHIGVMYFGRIVEHGDGRRVFDAPMHPYTRALLAAVPVADPSARAGNQRAVLPGEAPNPFTPPKGCPFRLRCAYAADVCAERLPELERGAHGVACHFPLEGDDR